MEGEGEGGEGESEEIGVEADVEVGGKEPGEEEKTEEKAKETGSEDESLNSIKGAAEAEEEDKAGGGPDESGDGAEREAVKAEDPRENNGETDKDEVREGGGSGAAEDIFHEIATDKIKRWDLGEEERRNANSKHRNQGDLGGDEWVNKAEENGGESHEEGENVFDEEEGTGALEIIDDAAPLRDDGRHFREIRFKKNHSGSLDGGAGARGHGDGAIGFLKSEDIVDAIAGHGDGVVAFKQFNEGELLVRGDTAEDSIGFN